MACAIFSALRVHRMKESFDKPACMPWFPFAAEQWGEAVEEPIEFGLQCQQLLLIHEQPLSDG